ncbi:hypothetical protein OsI_33658 [Oryza sativa Indica Group]|uniref:BTB domain-containing protein n=1 Tax=Oryza sativa subsp. indica TaxID=39946 RepID=B8BGX9_ORYSI|nr:hypothetical protein OsI_33658 [Oryza sativa Indica Group]
MSSSTAGVPSRSSSAIMVSTVRGYHLLKIDGYSRTKTVLSFDTIRTAAPTSSCTAAASPSLSSSNLKITATLSRRWERSGSAFLIAPAILMKEPSAVADPPAVVDVAVPLSELNRDMEALLQSEEGADVTFEVGGESFAAHRCVLAARSSVFRAELFGAMKESTAGGGKARVDGVEARAFKALLHFIYTDAAPELDGKDQDVGITM